MALLVANRNDRHKTAPSPDPLPAIILDTLHTMTNNSNSKLLWTLPCLVVAFGLLLAFMGLSEFYNVKIAGETSAYPFGPINENQWYYQNASVYANYNLTSGIMFLTASVVTVWATIKKNRPFVILGIGLTILFFIAELVSSKIQ